MAALAARSRPAGPGRVARHGAQPFLLLLPRDLAAGVLLRHGASGARRAGAVSGDLRRRARVVRLYLPADRMDRPDDSSGALLAGRPQRPHPSRQGTLGTSEALQQGYDVRIL